jgi:rod shape-determining protein MreD
MELPMQTKADSKGSMAIIISFAVAMLMNAMPWLDSLSLVKPDWVALVLIYWVMAIPNRIGVFSGFLLGLFVDVLDGNLFGINALSLAVVAYLIQIIFHRLRLFPRWKQAINVAVVIGIHKMIVLSLSSLISPVSIDFYYWLPLIGSALFWPWVFIILRDVRRNFC